MSSLNKKTNFYENTLLSASVIISALMRAKAYKHTRLKNAGSYILTANHTHVLNAPLIFGVMGTDTTNSLYPFSFITHNRFINMPVLGWFLRGVGCFPSKSHSKIPNGLDGAREAINRGRTLVIFPEGKVVKPGVQYRNHAGVAVLAKETGAKILPVHIRHRKNKQTIFGTNKLFRNVDVIFGEPFDGSDMNADEIMERVYDLKP